MPRKQIVIKTSKKPSSNPYFGWTGLLKEIPWTSIWNIILATGGLMLLMFFLSIGFLPDLDLKSVTTLLAAVAVVGLFLACYLGYALWLPSFMYGALSSSEARILTTKRILLESVSGALSTIFMAIILDGYGGADLQTTALRIIGCLVALLLVVYLLWSWSRQHLVAASTKGVISNDIQNNVEINSNPIAFMGWYLAFSKRYLLNALKPIEHQLQVLKLMASSFARILGWFAWTLLPTVLFIRMMKGGTGYFGGLFDLFLLLLALIVPVIAGLAIREELGQKVFVGFCAGAMIVCGAYLNRPFFISEIVMEFFGLSSRENVVVVLDEQACAAVNIQLGQRPCELDAASKLGKLAQSRLVSRVGLQTVLEIAQKPSPVAEGKITWNRVVVKSAGVISWSYGKPEPSVKVKTP